MSVKISQVFERAEKAGIHFYLDSDGVLLVESDQPITETQRGWIAEHKIELAEALRAEIPPPGWQTQEKPSVYRRILGVLRGGVDPIHARPSVRLTLEELAEAIGESENATALALCELERHGAIVFEHPQVLEGAEVIRFGYDDYYQPAARPKNPLDGMGNGRQKRRPVKRNR